MQLQEFEPLAPFSTFKIGGPARYFFSVTTIEQLAFALTWAKQRDLPVLIIGRGSNSLFNDRGFNGLAIHNRINECKIDGAHVEVGAGYNFSLLGVQTARKGLGGLEFASGIPGSVGGAIFMNAGANGGETARFLESVTFVDFAGEKRVFDKEELTFGYRTSSFHAIKGAIASATFSLFPAESARAKQLEIVAYRTKTQPYGDKSCGCVFRNPQGENAGALIEAAGMKGKKFGGAEVSMLHANFIVNREGATAEDVMALGKQVREIVEKKTGIQLEWELRRIPYDFPC